MASDWYQVGGVMGAACRLDFLTRLPKPPIYPMPLLLYANYSSGLINSRLFTRDHYLPGSRTLADVTVCPKVTRINWQTSVNWHLWRAEFNYETDPWLFQVQRSSASGPLYCSNYCFHNGVNYSFRNFFDFVSRSRDEFYCFVKNIIFRFINNRWITGAPNFYFWVPCFLSIPG